MNLKRYVWLSGVKSALYLRSRLSRKSDFSAWRFNPAHSPPPLPTFSATLALRGHHHISLWWSWLNTTQRLVPDSALHGTPVGHHGGKVAIPDPRRAFNTTRSFILALYEYRRSCDALHPSPLAIPSCAHQNRHCRLPASLCPARLSRAYLASHGETLTSIRTGIRRGGRAGRHHKPVSIPSPPSFH